MRYSDAFDGLVYGPTPRRKYAPDHWLSAVYFTGARVGNRVRGLICRTPVAVFVRGFRFGWSDD